MDELLEALKAVAEPTRLRIVVALESCELTVNEICIVLGQTQPRVSRHLKLLTDAGLLRRYAEGTSAYYGLRSDVDGDGLLRAIAPLIDRTDSLLERDQVRLQTVRDARAERAAEYFAQVAEEWDELRGAYAPTAAVEQAMLDAVETPMVNNVLDIGTGTGRILEVFADRTANGLGVDLSRQMLAVARARLDDDRLSHCSVRFGDILDLDLPAESQDVVIVHHVLHFLADPEAALHAAVRVLRPGGSLLVVDFAEHELERLRADHAHSHLGFSDEQIASWFDSLGLGSAAVQQFPPKQVADYALTVSLWAAAKPLPVARKKRARTKAKAST